MADRAAKSKDSSKEVFELDKDERWQARLAEARARREVALREKASSGASPRKRRKPWEEEGQGSFDEDVFEPIEPIIQPRDSDRPDFSDRLDSLKKEKARPAEHDRPLTKISPSIGGNGSPDAEPKESQLVPRKKEPVSKIADRYISALSPDFNPSRPYVPEPEEPEPVSPIVRARVPERREEVSEEPFVETEEEPREATVDAARPKPRRRDIPVLLVAGVCLLALMPFSTTTPPIQKGPYAGSVSTEFGLQPAFGITSPMNAFPRMTETGEWMPTEVVAPRGPLAAADNAPAELPRVIAPLGVIEYGPETSGNFGGTDISLPPIRSSTVELFAPAPDVLTGEAEPEVKSAAIGTATPVPRPTAENVLSVAVFYPESFGRLNASGVADLVQDRGHDLSALKVVDFSINRTNIRYYHSQDRDEAARLAEMIGGRLRDFTSFRPAPVNGTVEVWLAGE